MTLKTKPGQEAARLTGPLQRTQTCTKSISFIKTHTHTFNGLFTPTTWASCSQKCKKNTNICIAARFSGSTQVSQYQKCKTNLNFTEARDSERQWHQLGHMQDCTSLQPDNHASTTSLRFYMPYALPAAQPTASKHRRHIVSFEIGDKGDCCCSLDAGRTGAAQGLIQTSAPLP